MIMFLNLSDIVAEGMFRNCLSWCLCLCVCVCVGGGGISPYRPNKGVPPS